MSNSSLIVGLTGISRGRSTDGILIISSALQEILVVVLSIKNQPDLPLQTTMLPFLTISFKGDNTVCWRQSFMSK